MSSLARKGVVFWILLAVVVLLVLAPIYWIVATSFKTPTENILPAPTLYPHVLTLRNYVQVIEAGILRNFINSLFVAITATVVSLVLSFLAAYALGRHRFPLGLNSVFLVWVLAVKILPPIVLAIPLYTLFARVGLINSLWGLIIVYQVYIHCPTVCGSFSVSLKPCPWISRKQRQSTALPVQGSCCPSCCRSQVGDWWPPRSSA